MVVKTRGTFFIFKCGIVGAHGCGPVAAYMHVAGKLAIIIIMNIARLRSGGGAGVRMHLSSCRHAPKMAAKAPRGVRGITVITGWRAKRLAEKCAGAEARRRQSARACHRKCVVGINCK